MPASELQARLEHDSRSPVEAGDVDGFRPRLISRPLMSFGAIEQRSRKASGEYKPIEFEMIDMTTAKAVQNCDTKPSGGSTAVPSS